MSKRIDRRQALGAIGTISLGGLLAACGGDSGDGGSASVATTAGETATVEPKTTTSDATSALFDDAASCALTVEQTEGPYYFDADKIRSDIREDRKGTRLRLALRVRDAATCKPIPDAVVDIWHADAGGAYSGFDGGCGGDGADRRATCAARRSRTRTASPSSRRSTRAGIRAARRTSTRRSTSTARPS